MMKPTTSDTSEDESDRESLSRTGAAGNGLFSNEEASTIRRSKLLVYLVLVLTGCGVALGAYRYSVGETHGDFSHSFQVQAYEIIHETDNISSGIFASVHSLSVALTSLADNMNAVWPKVTEPNFNTIIEDAVENIDYEAFLFAPIVKHHDKAAFEEYAKANQNWLTKKGFHKDHKDEENEDHETDVVQFENVSDVIFPFPGSQESTEPEMYVPVWQYGPKPMDSKLALMDLYTHDVLRRAIDFAITETSDVLSDTLNADFILDHVQSASDHHDEHIRSLRKRDLAAYQSTTDAMYSIYLQPVHSNFTEQSEIVGLTAAIISWETFFSDMFQKSGAIDVVVEQSCGSTFTYRIDGNEAHFLGLGDLHDVDFSYTKVSAPLFDKVVAREVVFCQMTKSIYATREFKETFQTGDSILYTGVAIVIFLFTAAVFVFYDIVVQKRLHQIHATAVRSNAVVTSLFPKATAELLINQAAGQDTDALPSRGRPGPSRTGLFGKTSTSNDSNAFSAKPTDDITQLLRTSVGASQYIKNNTIEGRPLADLFPSATVMFADMTGFTAWSSAREPNQVFILLETIYGAFDSLAKRSRVFKVETIGDCYVAVCGLPEAREHHEVVMARFGHDCIKAMTVLTRQLEVKLGPETAELGLRVGLHSGSVTAGVLRGAKQRFQLFGDSVNTCARIESSGRKNQIHVSKETANGITVAGKGHWLTKRGDRVVAKGKGELETYWLHVSNDTGMSVVSSEGKSPAFDGDAAEYLLDIASSDDRQSRLVEWAVGLLENKLKKVIATRTSIQKKPPKRASIIEQKRLGLSEKDYTDTIIRIPSYRKPYKQVELDDVSLGKVVHNQLRDFVRNIAKLYRPNPFHNMEHAAHVANSVVKLFHSTFEGKGLSEEELDKQTFGISSDPLMRFTVVLSAIIHDMDHAGVPNSQLVKEGKGQGKSIAEAHSMNLAWELLMQDRYKDLRSVIYTSQEEYSRFRSVYISVVLSTDIMDKDLAAARRKRWESAFSEGFSVNVEGKRHDRSTIIIEHLIQASDVAHTMQHWHLYRKWNERLFQEMYTAYLDGRAEEDPCIGWYKSEIAFFNFYIIPLAKKLNDCGVYGSIGEEYLRYAERNRTEWEMKGQGIVQEMVSKLNSKPERPGDKYMI